MFENTKVTLSFDDFEELRIMYKAHKDIVSALSKCFEFSDCTYDGGKITVDIARLVKAGKEYSAYGKDMEIDDIEKYIVIYKNTEEK